mgnify:CR=1 FL=1
MTARPAVLEGRLLPQMARVFTAAKAESARRAQERPGGRVDGAGATATPVEKDPGQCSKYPGPPDRAGPPAGEPGVPPTKVAVTPKFWDVPGTPEELEQSITKLLDKLGGLLCPEARVRQVLRDDPETGDTEMVEEELAGSAALAAPLTKQVPGQPRPVPQCMLLDKTKVAGTRHVWQEDKLRVAYLRVDLGWVREETGVKPIPVCEYAHRLVLWAMHGPPPRALTEQGGAVVAMHTCHNPMCISPSHLVWGKDEENRGPNADDHALQMLTQQFRVVL